MLIAGQVYHATFQIGDGSGPPAGTVTLTITKPDGTTVAGVTPVNSPAGSGQYFYDYTLPAPGLFKFAWVSTTPGTAPTPVYENVRDYISIVSPGEIRQHLNKISGVSDDELASFLMAATELVENKVGPCVPRTFTERVDLGARNPLQLPVANYPLISVASVTSVWSGGPVWDNAATPGVLAVDADAGLVYQPSGFTFWWGPWDVVEKAGRQIIPERFIDAAKEQVRHLWETQRGSMPPALLQGEEVFTTTTGWTFSVPRRVLELLEQDMVPSS